AASRPIVFPILSGYSMAPFAGNADGVMGDTPPMDRLHPSRLPGGTAIQQRCSVQSTRPKGDAMQQHMVVAVMASVMWALVGGTALGQVAGSTTLGVTVDEQKVLAVGWSAKKTILDKAVYNSSGEKIGEVEDLIITPEKAVSYAIVGTGGFLGMAQHDVAIPVGQLKLEGDKLMLPGATKEGLKALPKFEYAKSERGGAGGVTAAPPPTTHETLAGKLSSVRTLPQHKKNSSSVQNF